MRIDTANFSAKNTSASKKPRYVVRIYFDNANTDYVEFTSHPNTETSGGTVISDVVRAISGTSQKINPDRGNSTIGGFSFSLVDKDSAITEYFRDKSNSGDGLRHKRVQCYVGYQDLLWEKYSLILTYIIDKQPTYNNGVYKITCSDIQRIVRKDIFLPEKTTLSQTVSSTQDFIPVTLSDLTKYPTILHDSSYSDRPSENVNYIIVDDEIICFSGIFTHTDAGPSFQVVERGALNTLAAVHESDTEKSAGNRKKVTEHIFIAGPAPKVAYQLLTGHVSENLLPYSEDFINPAWVLAGPTLNGNAAVAPDGTTTAERLNMNAGLGNHDIYDGSTTALNSIVTGSAFISNDGSRYAALTLQNGTVYAGIVVDLETGRVVSTDSSSGALVIRYAAIKHNTYWRIYITGNLVTETYVNLFIGGADGPSPTYTNSRPYYTAVAGEDLFIWGAQLSETNYFIPYVKTAGSAQAKESLPDNWHLGVSLDLVRLEDYTDLGDSMWNQFTDEGRHVRFEGHKKTDGKKFIETQIMLWLAAFMPVYSNGQIGIKLLSPILSDSSYIEELTARNVVSYGDLKHDYESVINKIVIDWNYVFGSKEYTKTSALLDSDSISKHNDAPIKSLKLRGVHTASHTDENLLSYFNSMRDRYSGPPELLSLKVLPSLNTLEVGDVVNVDLDQIRDFNVDSGTSLNRAFEIQQVSTNWMTGYVNLKLFGSSQKAGELTRSALSSVLDDSFYTSDGTELSTVLTIVGSSVTVSGSLTGGDTMAEGIYYYDGNLTIDSGVVITIDKNTQLRIKGHLTINGDIDGKGQGYSGGAGATLWSNGTTTFTGDHLTHNAGIGVAGYIGTTRPCGDLPPSNRLFYGFYDNDPTVTAGDAVNYFDVVNNSASLTGLPANLMGSSGSGGGVTSFGSNRTRTIEVVGTDGGNSGAGLLIISRGSSFGIGGSIDLSGDDAIENNGSAINASGSTAIGSPGAGGAAGGLLILIDGNSTSPSIGANFIANHGNSPYRGDRSNTSSYQDPYSYSPLIGFAGGSRLKSSYRLQYLPESETIEEEQKDKFVIGEAFLQSWTARRSAAQVNFLDVSYGNGLIVAVGSNIGGTAGIIQSSSDNGNSWTARTVPGTVSAVNGTAYGSGLFVAVGQKDGVDGYIATSTDGITWVERTNPQNLNLSTVAFNNGLFVAAGESSAGGPITYIATSTDGITWVDRSPAVFYGNCSKVIWGNNEWIIISSVVLTSPDGITWTQIGSTSVSLYSDLVWDGKNYVATYQAGVYGDGIYVSPDGDIWTGKPTPHDTPLRAIEYAQGVYVATGDEFASQTVILTSKDATDWTNINVPANVPSTRMTAITFINNKFVIVGQNVDATYGGAVLTSVRVDY